MSYPATAQAKINPGNHTQNLDLVDASEGTYAGGDGPFTAVALAKESSGDFYADLINFSGVSGFGIFTKVPKTATPTDDPFGRYTSGTITIDIIPTS
ncbi:MAG: hypothetical protein AAF593_01305 [Planctomycetota bacterium]